MEKIKVIAAVMEVFDRAEKAEAELTRRNQEMGCDRSDRAEETRFNFFDLLTLKVGANKIVKDSIDYWHEVRANRNDETSVVSVEPYDKWAERVVNRIPDEFSKKDFFAYFDKELREFYEKEKDNAIAVFEQEEEE